MVLIPFALAAGLVLGLLRRGQPENLLGFKPSMWLLGLGGMVALLFGEYGSLPRDGAVGLVIVGSLSLLFFLAKNSRFTGTITLAIGLGLNLLVVVANGHVPVRYDALVAAGEIKTPSAPEAVLLTGLRELEVTDTRLDLLGDVVPIGILKAVVSFGDLILAAGAVVFAMHLLIARRRRGIDLDDLLGPEVFEQDSALDLRMSPGHESEIDLRPTGPKLVPAASEKAQVIGPGEPSVNRLN